MGSKFSEAGDVSGKVRSDCAVALTISDGGGQRIEIKSKVAALYGNSIRKLCKEVLDHFEISSCDLKIDDTGALPFVIAARLEAAIKKIISTEKKFLIGQSHVKQTARYRDRVTRLYLPGNNPALMINASIHRADGLILDLEDAVAADKKDEARILVRNALMNLDFGSCERMVRINPGISDLEEIIPYGANLILIPKAESREQILEIDAKIKSLRVEYKIEHEVWLMPIIESALGVIKAFDIATSTNSIVAMAIGLEDYTASIGAVKTKEGLESFFARSQVLNACKAAGIQAIDSVFGDVGDAEGLQETAQRSRALGYDGMGCIHPSQIAIIKKAFAPSAKEIEEATRIHEAFVSATQKGLGVVSLGSKMIDAPVVKRALQTLRRANIKI